METLPGPFPIFRAGPGNETSFCFQWRSQDEHASNVAQHGHIQCVRNTQSASGPRVCSHHKKTHLEIASEAIFGHKYYSFSLTCMLASCPHQNLRSYMLITDYWPLIAFYIIVPGYQRISRGHRPGYAQVYSYATVNCCVQYYPVCTSRVTGY